LGVFIAFNPAIDGQIDQRKDAVGLLLESDFNAFWALGMEEKLNLLTD
jgi:hypothetical protein